MRCRGLETLTLEGNTISPTLLIPELRLALAGGLERGLTAVQTSLAAGAVSGSSLFAAGRRLGSVYQGLGGATVFGERQSLSPRSLTTARTRLDDPTQSRAFAYDPAGRLTVAAQVPDPAAAFPNNTTATVATIEQGTTFSYDPAQNLLARTEVEQGIAEIVPTPPDASDRNRPASVGGVPLAYDANGNLTARADQRLYYDERNRLTRVTTAGGTEIVRYEYDVFDRRIRKMLPGTTEHTVYAGWQALEAYQDGQLHQRRTWGLGIDEAVRLETDFSGDGVPDTVHLPLYDGTGSLAAVTNASGELVERYEYSSFGERRVLVDSTPPEVEQVRVVGDELWLEFSEAVSGDLLAAAAAGTLELKDTATSTPVLLTVSQPVATGRQARKRIVLTPDVAPAEGEEVRLTLPAEAVKDSFLNQPGSTHEVTFNWPSEDAVIDDTTAPEIRHVLVRNGRLEVQFTETPDLAAATDALQLNSAAVTWELSPDGYTLTTADALPAGSHTLTVGTGALDLAGNGLAESFSVTIDPLTVSGTGFVFEEPDPCEVAVTTTRNPLGFQGLPIDAETGLVYVRNRYFDPELGRFTSSDPMGYVDGPNSYQFGLNSPVDFRDPLGLEAGWQIAHEHRRLEEAGISPYRHGDRDLETVAYLSWRFGLGEIRGANEALLSLPQLLLDLPQLTLATLDQLADLSRCVMHPKICAEIVAEDLSELPENLRKSWDQWVDQDLDLHAEQWGESLFESSLSVTPLTQSRRAFRCDLCSNPMPDVPRGGNGGGSCWSLWWNWQRASLDETVSRIAGPNRIVETTASGKQIFRNPDTGLQVVYDSAGNYFRVENPAAQGVGRYLDLYGNEIRANVPLVGPRGTTQTGVPRDVRNALTHFLNVD